MNISKIIAAGALATSLAVAQEDAWPTDEQTEEQVSEQAAEQADEQATEAEEAEQSSDGSASSPTESPAQAEARDASASSATEAAEVSEPAETQTAYADAPQKLSTLNDKAGFGIHGDFNYSFLTGLAQDWNMGDETDAPAGIGFDVGIRGRIPMVNFLQFAPEINFHYATLIQEDETAERKFKQMDLEIPLMIRALIQERFYIAAGIQFTLNLSSDVKIEEEDVDIGGGLGTMSMSFDEEIEQAGFGFGLSFGVGVFVIDRLSIDAGIVLGLTTIYENKEEDEDRILVNMDGGKQITFKAGVGFWFM